MEKREGPALVQLRDLPVTLRAVRAYPPAGARPVTSVITENGISSPSQVRHYGPGSKGHRSGLAKREQ
ncbi:hypothetical protein Nans01_39140 [Nocardiopsis ansamitocini]|uniref:Uncharacterized protein n=1 Tax=Nocardiopsis ansamitocini TaxID=1670832 RepID=A0A9W6UKG3_9ACTN|nr:hypothetical protein Nans01_39140 [Nocardiopsis ansamitocini]